MCAIVGVITPREAHQVALTRSLAQICASRMPYLQLLVHSQHKWLQCSALAASHVLSVLGATPLPPVPTDADDMNAWAVAVAEQLGNVSAILRRFCRQACRQRQALADKAVANAKGREALVAQGVVMEYISEEPASQPKEVVCPVCQRRFANVAGQAAHARRMHGKIALHTQALRGTACLVCCREYWSAQRLREHLRFSTRCCHVYIEADLGPPLAHKVGCERPFQ